MIIDNETFIAENKDIIEIEKMEFACCDSPSYEIHLKKCWFVSVYVDNFDTMEKVKKSKLSFFKKYINVSDSTSNSCIYIALIEENEIEKYKNKFGINYDKSCLHLPNKNKNNWNKFYHMIVTDKCQWVICESFEIAKELIKLNDLDFNVLTKVSGYSNYFTNELLKIHNEKYS